MTTAPDVLALLAEEFHGIVTALRPLAAGFAAVIETTDPPTRDDLASLRPAILDVLADRCALVTGAGVFTAPDLLADARHWLEWWWTRTSGAPESLRVNLDPTAPDFFDYTNDDWYVTPARTGAPHVAGPFVDYACTNQYALTVSVPVTVGRRLVGVAASDVLLSSLEARILPGLHRVGEPMVLLNANGRVVMSSSADFAPGDRFPPEPDEPAAPPRAPRRVPGAAALGWRLATVR
jgi:hypothetical protein